MGAPGPGQTKVRADLRDRRIAAARKATGDASTALGALGVPLTDGDLIAAQRALQAALEQVQAELRDIMAG